MNIKKIQTVLLASIMVVFLIAAPARAEEELILYVQEGCGHCAKVEKFIEDNELGDHIVIKDTILDPGVSEEYTEALESLEVPLEESGVPLLVINGEDYFIGDTPIISYLRDLYEIDDTSADVDTDDTMFLVFGGGIVVSIMGYGIYTAVQGKSKK